MNYFDEVRQYPADEECPATNEVIITAVFSTGDAIELARILKRHFDNQWAVSMYDSLCESLGKIHITP